MPADGTALPAIGDEIAGKYRVESVLGQGGMGAVFAARNKLTGKRVAIKWLLPEHSASVTRERLLREAQIASSIDHPNVVDIYDVGEHQGGLFLVMEYLRGRPLSEVLAERGRLDPDELIALLVPAMRGVHAAHLAGVIHRDLKPDNIILSEQDGQIVPKVLDFGVSKQVGASSIPNSSLTRTGALVGTPHYMALEQVDGSNAIDTRTDVYAFGVLIYRALTGHFPFDGSSLGEVILKIGTKEAAPMRLLRPDLPPGIDTVVLRALSRDRQLRFKDLEELARALMPFATRADGTGAQAAPTPGAVSFRSLGVKSVADTSETGATSVAQASAPARTPGKRRALYVAAALFVLLLAGALLLRRDAEPPSAQRTAVPLDSSEPSAKQEPVVGVAAPEVPREPPQETEPAALPPTTLPSTTHAAPSAAAVEERASDSAAAPSAALTPSARAAAAKLPANRAKHVRPVVPARKSSGPALIPGERTNGLSVDEF